MIACGEKQDHLYLEKDNNLVWNFEDIFCLHVPSNLCCGLQLTSYAQKAKYKNKSLVECHQMLT